LEGNRKNDSSTLDAMERKYLSVPLFDGAD
jgi:hypothetical protein